MARIDSLSCRAVVLQRDGLNRRPPTRGQHAEVDALLIRGYVRGIPAHEDWKLEARAIRIAAQDHERCLAPPGE